MDPSQVKEIIREVIRRELEGLQACVEAAPPAVSPAPAALQADRHGTAPRPSPPGPSSPLEVRLNERVVTAKDLEGVESHSVVVVPQGAIISPLVHDVAAARKIRIRFADSDCKPSIAIASDHGGFKLKEAVKGFLAEWGYPLFDFGTDSEDPVDYPEYAHKVAKSVAEHHHEFGIVVDGAGIGSCMAANKCPGVRAAFCPNPAVAKNSREHNFANVLALGGRSMSVEEAREVVRVWLETAWGEERHARRVRLITEIERKYSKE